MKNKVVVGIRLHWHPTTGVLLNHNQHRHVDVDEDTQAEQQKHLWE